MWSPALIEEIENKEYKYGFVTDVEVDEFPKGLSEDIVRRISAIKEEPEFVLEYRLKAYKHWLKLKEPEWANVTYKKVDFQNLKY